MTELVFIESDRLVTDSLTVAATFDKEHKHVMRDVRGLECSQDFHRSNFGLVDYKDDGGRTYQKYIITEQGFAFLVMGYTGKEAARFKELYISEFNRMRNQLLLNDSIRTSRYDDPSLLQFKKEVYFLEAASEILRLPESGKLKLLSDFNKQKGLLIPLPAYADEQVTESATVLLKKHGVSVQTAAFNQLMIANGLLEELERPSSKGGTKCFKSLTERGLEYGKNIISPSSPRETQPHYYADKFVKLLQSISLKGEVS
jgi:phage regulatory protein, rha family